MEIVARRVVALVALVLAGCAQTTVQPEEDLATGQIPRPSRILVRDFAIQASEVTSDPGIVSSLVGSPSMSNAQLAEVGRKLSARLAEKIVAQIQALGMPAERGRRDERQPLNSLLVDGWFLDVNEGNRLQRVVIGFGFGGTSIDTDVRVLRQRERERVPLLAFETHATSSMMPGLAVTGVAGGVASGAAGVAVASGVGALKELDSSIDADADRTAKKVVAFLASFFANQGWISDEVAAALESPIP